MENHSKPNVILEIIFKLDKNLARAGHHVATAFFIVMILFMILQVVFRFVLRIPAAWTEELTRYTWIGLSYIGATVVTQRKEHIEIDAISPLFDKIKKEKTKANVIKVLDLFRYSVVLAYCSYIAYICFNFTVRIFRMGQTTPALMMPKWIIDAVICFGFIGIAFHCLIILLRVLLDKPEIKEA